MRDDYVVLVEKWMWGSSRWSSGLEEGLLRMSRFHREDRGFKPHTGRKEPIFMHTFLEVCVDRRSHSYMGNRLRDVKWWR